MDPNPILLLGPDDDAALHAFANYLRTKEVRFQWAQSLKLLKWNLTLRESLTGRMYCPDGSEAYSMVVRNLEHLIPWAGSPSDDDSRFIAQELLATIWTALFSSRHSVINRPLASTWRIQLELQRRIPSELRVPERWVTEAPRLLCLLEARVGQVHVEDLPSGNRFVLEEGAGLSDIVGAGPFRAILTDGSRYRVDVVVDDEVFCCRDDYGSNPNNERYLVAREIMCSRARHLGVRFYAIAWTWIGDSPRVVRIDPNPPFDWFASRSDEVFEALHSALLHQPIPASKEALACF